MELETLSVAMMSHVEYTELGSWTPKQNCPWLLLYSDRGQQPLRVVRGGSVGHWVLWIIMTPLLVELADGWRSQEVDGLVKRGKEQEERWEGAEGSKIKLVYSL